MQEEVKLKLTHALGLVAGAIEYSRQTLQRATVNLILHGGLDEPTLHWPEDLNQMLDYAAKYNYASLHTFDFGLPAEKWTGAENYQTLLERFINYNADPQYSAQKQYQQPNWV